MKRCIGFHAGVVMWLLASACSRGGLPPAGDHPDVDAGVVAPDLAPGPERERCNGRDDDLDGRIDEGCPIRLTFSPDDDTQAIVQGGQVVWARSVPIDGGYRQDLWLRSLPNGPGGASDERLIVENVGGGFSLFGDRVSYWRDQQLIVHDFVTGQEQSFAPAAHAYYSQGSTLGANTVFWDSELSTPQYDG